MKLLQSATWFVAGSVTAVLAATTLMPQQDLDANQDEAKAWDEAMQKYGVPGEEHKLLARRAGTWNCEIKMWHAPDMEPEISKGRAQNEMIMGGRYLYQRFEAEFMDQPFEGGGLTGYDRMKKHYTSVWADDWSTAIMVSHGKAEGSTINFRGEMPNIMAGQYMKSRMIEKMPNDDTVVMEMWHPGPDGKDFKAMEITYNRTSARVDAPTDR